MEFLQYIIFPANIRSFSKLDGYGSINYKVSLANGTDCLVKVYNATEQKQIQEEERVIALLQASSGIQLTTPAPVKFLSATPADIYIRVSKFIDGVSLTKELATDTLLANIARAAATMLTRLQKIDSDIIKAREHDWNIRDALRNKSKIDFIKKASDKKIVHHYLSLFEAEIIPAFQHLQHSVIHGDLNEANILIKDDKVAGFIDFGDISYAPVVCELAVLLTYVMMMFPDECFEKAKIIIEHFQKTFPLTEEELEILPQLIATRLSVSVCKSAAAKAASEETDYILISEKPAWHLLYKWIAINPLRITHIFMNAAGFSAQIPDTLKLLKERKKVASPGLGLSYRKPIHMAAALFQYMYAADGNTYLDAYNNIPHVGHCHPAVTEAASRQIRKLNTNTRYLFESYVSYSGQLLSLFPVSLDKVFLVNSGSEASDLAIRIAKTVTGKKGVAVLEWSYHGHTQNGINISSHKFDKQGGSGPAEWILRLPLPKAFNGRHPTAKAYFEDARKLIEDFESNGNSLAAFIAEPISGCGGQVPLIDGYLNLLTPYLRAKGILIIIDEVQTGFGRLGKWFWGFEMHGIVPDLVVLGKPMGNGHPMGAVVTSAAITDAFNNGMEFFSSFGGNPVSCETGKAVIATIKNEGLQQNALEVGSYWLEQLRSLQKQIPVLGDVRGDGLFIGVECVDEQGKENTALAQEITNVLKEKFILTSTDGPLNNVLKMKPPLCFTKENVDRHIETLHAILKNG